VAARRRAKPAHATLSTEQAAPAAAPATPPVIVAAPPVAAAAPAKAQPAPALDPELARVSITAVTTTNAVPAASIRAALARVPLARCYREALRAGSAAAGGTATLRLHVDMAGYVTDASLQDAQFLPGMKGCIEQAARVARVRDVDTGEGTADVTLSFVPR
jgi:hypothetical protein